MLLLPGQDHVVTHVFTRNNITFFKIGNESFCTSAGHIYHVSSPMYDSAPLKMFAAQAHDQSAIDRHQEMINQVEADDNDWQKRKRQVYRKVFTAACEIMVEHGEEAMEKYIEDHFEIYPEDKARLL